MPSEERNGHVELVCRETWTGACLAMDKEEAWKSEIGNCRSDDPHIDCQWWGWGNEPAEAHPRHKFFVKD